MSRKARQYYLNQTIAPSLATTHAEVQRTGMPYSTICVRRSIFAQSDFRRATSSDFETVELRRRRASCASTSRTSTTVVDVPLDDSARGKRDGFLSDSTVCALELHTALIRPSPSRNFTALRRITRRHQEMRQSAVAHEDAGLRRNVKHALPCRSSYTHVLIALAHEHFRARHYLGDALNFTTKRAMY